MIYTTHNKFKERNDYTTNSLRDLQETVESSIRALKPYVDDFDSIVVTGMSGVVVGAPVALALEKPLVIVRKPSAAEWSHSTKPIINVEELGARTLFLDDFVSGGETRDRVLTAVADKTKVTHEYMYADDKVEVVAERVKPVFDDPYSITSFSIKPRRGLAGDAWAPFDQPTIISNSIPF